MKQRITCLLLRVPHPVADLGVEGVVLALAPGGGAVVEAVEGLLAVVDRTKGLEGRLLAKGRLGDLSPCRCETRRRARPARLPRPDQTAPTVPTLRTPLSTSPRAWTVRPSARAILRASARGRRRRADSCVEQSRRSTATGRPPRCTGATQSHGCVVGADDEERQQDDVGADAPRGPRAQASRDEHAPYGEDVEAGDERPRRPAPSSSRSGEREAGPSRRPAARPRRRLAASANHRGVGLAVPGQCASTLTTRPSARRRRDDPVADEPVEGADQCPATRRSAHGRRPVHRRGGSARTTCVPVHTRHWRSPEGSGYQPGGAELVDGILTALASHTNRGRNTDEPDYEGPPLRRRDHRITSRSTRPRSTKQSPTCARGREAWAATHRARARADLLERDRQRHARRRRGVERRGVCRQGLRPAAAPRAARSSSAASARSCAWPRRFASRCSTSRRKGRPQYPGPVRHKPGERIAVQVVPATIFDKILYAGITGEVWMEPGVSEAEVKATQAAAYQSPSDARRACRSYSARATSRRSGRATC